MAVHWMIINQTMLTFLDVWIWMISVHLLTQNFYFLESLPWWNSFMNSWSLGFVEARTRFVRHDFFLTSVKMTACHCGTDSVLLVFQKYRNMTKWIRYQTDHNYFKLIGLRTWREKYCWNPMSYANLLSSKYNASISAWPANLFLSCSCLLVFLSQCWWRKKRWPHSQWLKHLRKLWSRSMKNVNKSRHEAK